MSVPTQLYVTRRLLDSKAHHCPCLLTDLVGGQKSPSTGPSPPPHLMQQHHHNQQQQQQHRLPPHFGRFDVSDPHAMQQQVSCVDKALGVVASCDLRVLYVWATGIF